MKNLLKNHIQKSGPMPLYEYMTLALYHPEKGYYTSQNPFGDKGDFITAPELTQVFGEMVCGWLIDAWIKLGQPNPFHLVELGPGRGYLMSDIVRTANIYPPFFDALHVHLVEISPALKKIQSEQIKFSRLTWHDDLQTLPQETCFFLGNEFLDALPIRQFVRQDNHWCETYVDFDDEKHGFNFIHMQNNKPYPLGDLDNGSVIEVNESAIRYCDEMAQHLEKHGGLALMIDYGHFHNPYKESLRSYVDHKQISPLEKPGESDLTAHVDFEKLIKFLNEKNIYTQTSTQAHWLASLGFFERISHLKQHQPDTAKFDKIAEKLTSPNEMGDIFKVLAFSPQQIDFLGFQNE